MNQLLFEILEHTHRSLFLTGKAGTGKTTFLNNFVKKTQKKHIVLAPTGIAAINAGGVTIHSMFGFPLRTFIPTTERIDSSLANNITDLLSHFKYRKDKLKLLREVELIIIDEVSMLRADVLDMMDFALRHIRRNQNPFGGVQFLFIGDLFQLPPVVRDENILLHYYETPFFFSSKSLQGVSLLTFELDKVYRQQDETFLSLLNAIREGNLNDINFELLNSRYLPQFQPQEEAYIYLTSHNKMAHEVNQKKLNELPGNSYFFNASITGDFKENQYPNDLILELKVGAQVMFIRNDATHEKKYYNGKLAEVIHVDEEEIYVRMENSEEDYLLKKESWEHKSYSLDAEKNIEERVLGSFEQYPIRLAWAVTIHKSQGLTFDRVIIDAGSSFASGQVYVALSRCRTLEGIVLKSKITPETIIKDNRVIGFQDATYANDRIETILKREKYDYSLEKMLQKMHINWLSNEIIKWYKEAQNTKKINQEKLKSLQFVLQKETENLRNIYEKFSRVIRSKTQKFIQGEEAWIDIEEKAKGATLFFFTTILEKIFDPLKEFYAEYKGTSGMKSHNEILKTLLEDLEEFLIDLQNLTLLETPLYTSEKREISIALKKIPTHIITWNLFQEGKLVTEIAKQRGVLLPTIMGHFTKFAETGLLTANELERILPKEKIKTFESLYKVEKFDHLNDWKKALPEEFEYGEIRLLWSFFSKKSSENIKK